MGEGENMDPLKKHFQTRGPSGAPGECLSEDVLFRLTHEKPAPPERERAMEHAMQCSICTEKIATLKSLADEPPADRDLSPRLLGKTPAKRRARFSTPIGVWLALFALFMTLSFVWPLYFVQMVVTATVFGGKWLIESRARHLHIQITHGAGGSSSASGDTGGRVSKRLSDIERSVDD